MLLEKGEVVNQVAQCAEAGLVAIVCATNTFTICTLTPVENACSAGEKGLASRRRLQSSKK
jgi:hypothetical protein